MPNAVLETMPVVMRKLVLVLGIPIDDVNMAEALNRLEAFIHIGRHTGKSHQIATVNADFVVKALHDPELRYLLQEADMATADGMPLVWGARLLGVSLEDRVAGSDMVPALVQRAAKKGYSVYFLGAAPGVAARAAQRLQEQYPQLIVAGVCSPPYTPVLEMDPAILEAIQAARPDILLVAFGNPKQEKWIGMVRRQINVPVMIGVGATLDFIAGSKKRAPKWMQKVGMEWLHRLLQEPQRLLRRYVVDLTLFSTFFLRQWWLIGRQSQPAAVLPHGFGELLLVEGKGILNIEGRLTADNCRMLLEAGQQALATTPFLVINLAYAEFLDSSAIGMLVDLTKQARERGGEVTLAATPTLIRQTLKLLRLDAYFVFQASIESALQADDHALGLGNGKQEQVASATNWTVIQVPRRLDHTTAPAVAENWCAMAAAAPFVILDFSQTALVTSAGLALLARLHRETQAGQGELRLVNCSKDVCRVIELVRFDKMLSLYPSLSAALG
jgi:N-acetylglucosaminyldiphosphoundecaprenol N-acetyl-beta-D-mannosaminyltransferase